MVGQVEVCINSENIRIVRQAVRAAYLGGAARVELCRAMALAGLTPRRDHIVAARLAFEERPGLLVMIRPRGGDFVYNRSEVRAMLRQIEIAATCGADGVVFGALEAGTQRVDRAVLRQLVAVSGQCGLQTTFHRAFDAAPDPFAALDLLIDHGLHRVLTAGMPWGQRDSALDGASRLAQVVQQATGRIEVVIGGGVNPVNIGHILGQLPLNSGPVSIHAYSGAQDHGRTTVESVRAFVQAAQAG